VTRLEYKEPQPISRADAESAFGSGDPYKICDALVRLVYHDPDWKWVELTCLDYCIHAEPGVRGVAATCLGELARIHRKLDVDLVIPLLRTMLDDQMAGGSAQDALDDIQTFLDAKVHSAGEFSIAEDRTRSEGMTPRFEGVLSSAVPEGWRVKETLTILAPAGEANVIASSEPVEGDSEQYATSQGISLRTEFNNFRELSYGPAKFFGGLHCYERLFEWSAPGHGPVTQIQVYYAAFGRGYTMTATALSIEFGALEPILRSILEGVLIDNGTPPGGRADPLN
jgi:hypothetical protein